MDELFDSEPSEIAEHNRQAIEWLKGFKYTGHLQSLVAKYKFTIQELEFLRSAWMLIPKKKQTKGSVLKWG